MGYLAAVLIVCSGGNDYEAFAVFKQMMDKKGVAAMFEDGFALMLN